MEKGEKLFIPSSELPEKQETPDVGPIVPKGLQHEDIKRSPDDTSGEAHRDESVRDKQFEEMEREKDFRRRQEEAKRLEESLK